MPNNSPFIALRNESIENSVDQEVSLPDLQDSDDDN